MALARAGYAAGGAATISSLYLFYQAIHSLSKGQEKDSYFERLSEIAKSRLVKGSISDPYTAQEHVKLARSLSSAKPIGKHIELSKQQLYSLQGTYFIYLACVLKEHLHKTKSPPVFDYVKNLQIPPLKSSENLEAYQYAGTVKSLHDLRARERILEGNYIRCSKLLKTGDDESTGIDVILTGVTQPKQCKQFENRVGLEAIRLATYEKNRDSPDKGDAQKTSTWSEEDCPTPQPEGPQKTAGGSKQDSPAHQPNASQKQPTLNDYDCPTPPPEGSFQKASKPYRDPTA